MYADSAFCLRNACSTIREGCGVVKIAPSAHGDGDVGAQLTPACSQRFGETKALQW